MLLIQVPLYFANMNFINIKNVGLDTNIMNIYIIWNPRKEKNWKILPNLKSLLKMHLMTPYFTRNVISGWQIILFIRRTDFQHILVLPLQLKVHSFHNDFVETVNENTSSMAAIFDFKMAVTDTNLIMPSMNLLP